MTTGDPMFIVRGISMLPVLRTGDQVELHPVERHAIHCGDILVFTDADGREIIHRVIRTTPLQTRGDNCTRNDQPVPSESPLFIARAFFRGGKYVTLSCGKRGRFEFLRNQFRCKCLFPIRKILCFAAQCNPWRIRFSTLKPSRFGEKTIYYAGTRPVGWQDSNGWHWMRFARFFVEAPPKNFLE